MNYPFGQTVPASTANVSSTQATAYTVYADTGVDHELHMNLQTRVERMIFSPRKKHDDIGASAHGESSSRHTTNKRRSTSPTSTDGMDLEDTSVAVFYGNSQSSQQSPRSSPRRSTRVSTARQKASLNQQRVRLFKEVLYFHKKISGSVSIDRDLVEISSTFPQTSIATSAQARQSKRRRGDNVSDRVDQQGLEVPGSSPRGKDLAQESILKYFGLGKAESMVKSWGPLPHDPANPDISDDHPFSLLARRADVVFLSQLIPQKFDDAVREGILELVQRRAPYIPLCIAQVDPTTRRKTVWENALGATKAKGKPSRKFRHPLGSKGNGWPTRAALPVEIFEMIAQSLSRDDVQKMRLVNREFERKISCFVFRSVVVPFRPKIYGISSSPSPEPQNNTKEPTTVSGDQPDLVRPSFNDTYNPKESHVKDGMRVFDQWGPEIKKFALAFEVDEDSLVGLLPKKKANVKTTFWGSYEWPHAQYNRFAQAERYEKKADEMSRMSAAFRQLTGLRELGLSVISGQGWLAGPDVSDRVKILKRETVVFGSHYSIPDKRVQGRLNGWDKVVQEETRKVKELFYINRASRSFFATVRKKSSMSPKVEFVHKTPPKSGIQPPIVFNGENAELKSQRDHTRDYDAYRVHAGESPKLVNFDKSDLKIVPNKLTAEQEEWLLEMEWAQTAFLSSWCIAVLDNRTTFSSLRAFNIANLSSKYLGCLHRLDIWQNLPSLESLTIMISPDWRRLELDYKDEAVSQRILPSSCHSEFYAFLSFLFGNNPINTNIKTLNIGYVGGGEHAPGMYARNKNILPAPIMSLHPIDKFGPKIRDTLTLTHIQHLTLKNCWITPQAIRSFFSSLGETKPEVQTTTFDSVSLTADTDYTAAELLELHQSMDRSGFGRPDRLNHWLQHDPIHGSWADLINSITPGPSIQDARNLHLQSLPSTQNPTQPIHADGPLTPHPYAHAPPIKNKTLKAIKFHSCGYARLTHLPADDGWWQTPIPEPIATPPECLKA
ncbi:MAG: hypothetical protein Q9218_006798, partial [Villophora microphyllina]